ncbi:hypothetical protein J2Z65_005626 [Paenibacillus aceris]|uniref:Uncharacterized protein n=1 Tax=Paenibacillus aceris TaxID=869555 RepID=A0ABS4I637_9BACL|nr:hypothetical protein [Paenibacillus aceris]
MPSTVSYHLMGDVMLSLLAQCMMYFVHLYHFKIVRDRHLVVLYTTFWAEMPLLPAILAKWLYFVQREHAFPRN